MSIEHGKVALITGGASGIGIRFAKSLLKNGLKGVTLVDINPNFGKKAMREIEKEFGKDRAIFVETDVSNKKQLEDAFKRTIDKFKQLDIVINNAGVINEEEWEKEINVNCKGTVNGTLLAVEDYLPKFKSGEEGIVVNISSIAALDSISFTPFYSAAASFIVGFSTGMGSSEHYIRTKIRVLVICPGPTWTGMATSYPKLYKMSYFTLIRMAKDMFHVQKPEHVAEELLTVLNEGKSGSAWVIENSKPAYEVDLKKRAQRLNPKSCYL